MDLEIELEKARQLGGAKGAAAAAAAEAIAQENAKKAQEARRKRA
jgi:hypothetical protein